MRPLVLAAAAAVLVLGLTQTAFAAVTISRAELSGTQLRVEGSGAKPGAAISIDGVAMGSADSAGTFRIEKSGFTSATCKITVSDGTTSAQVTLSGCTPSQTQPPPPPPPPSGPATPTPLAPTGGAAVVQPFALSWSVVTDPVGLVGYNWEISAVSTFAVVATRDSTGPTTTEARVSGLPNGTYFWRVQSARASTSDPAQSLSAWSGPVGFSVTGSAPGTPGTPTITAPANLTQFHPFEYFPVTWTAVAGAATYTLEASVGDSTFQIGGNRLDTRGLTTTSYTWAWGGSETDVYFRARGVSADGTLGLPSPVIHVLIRYTAPLPPPPSLLSPAEAAQVSLPVLLDWTDDPNPQPYAYELWIDDDPTFPGGYGFIEGFVNTSASQYLLGSGLPSGTHYWRVRAFHGNASPTTGAVTAWSAVRSFKIPATPPSLVSLTLDHTFAYSGQTYGPYGQVNLSTPTPAGGAVVALSSSNPAAASVPVSVTVAAGQALASFRITPGQVDVDTLVTITATLGATSFSATLTVEPASLATIELAPTATFGGPGGIGYVGFNGTPPAGAPPVQLTSSDPTVVQVPASLSLDGFWQFPFTTSKVTVPTTVTITASWKGASVQLLITLNPAPTLLSPANGATTPGGLNVLFDWNDLVGMHYQIQIDETSAFTPPLTIDTGSNWSDWVTFSPLPSGTWYWRVRAGDIYGHYGDWSLVSSFTVSGPVLPLPAPSLLFPANGSRFTQGQLITFYWSGIAGAGSYEVQIDDASTIAAPYVVDQPGLTDTTWRSSTLPARQLWWRARAIDGRGGSPGAWSSVRSLEVKN